MSQEISQGSVIHEALSIVRSLRHRLMWQQAQGWRGVPTGDANRWDPTPLSKLLVRTEPQPPAARSNAPREVPSQRPVDGVDWREKMRAFADPTPPPPSRPTETLPHDLPPPGHDAPFDIPPPDDFHQPAAPPPKPPTPVPTGPLDIGPLPVRLPLQMRPTISLDEESRIYNRLERLRAQMEECQRCSLSSHRRNILHGAGPPRARLMIICPQPNGDEDEQGKSFVGDSGRLLQAMLAAIGVSSDDVYIAYQNRCRTRDNAPPVMDQIHECFPYLIHELRIIQPDIVLAMGAAVAQTLLQKTDRLDRLREQWYPLHEGQVLPNARRPCHMLVTYHPFYLLRRPLRKMKAWQDLQMVRERLLTLEASG